MKPKIINKTKANAKTKKRNGTHSRSKSKTKVNLKKKAVAGKKSNKDSNHPLERHLVSQISSGHAQLNKSFTESIRDDQMVANFIKN